jgi:hypothetical protein
MISVHSHPAGSAVRTRVAGAIQVEGMSPDPITAHGSGDQANALSSDIHRVPSVRECADRSLALRQRL